VKKNEVRCDWLFYIMDITVICTDFSAGSAKKQAGCCELDLQLLK